jgi:hypothetical protein
MDPSDAQRLIAQLAQIAQFLAATNNSLSTINSTLQSRR